MRTISVVGLAIAVALMALLLSTSHASAQPVPGAYYAGEITGCGQPPCGTVAFRVSEDGSQVEWFAAYDVPGDTCQFKGPQPYPDSLDIDEGDCFGSDQYDFYQVGGCFVSEDSAQGTLRLKMGEPLCDTGLLDWTASVSQGPVGGIAVLPDIADSAARHYAALAALAAAALVVVTTGAWHARRRRSR
ncbi:MAG: hypothetical protein ACUVV3_00555 [Dehalococcoidia bacterium]